MNQEEMVATMARMGQALIDMQQKVEGYDELKLKVEGYEELKIKMGELQVKVEVKDESKVTTLKEVVTLVQV